MQATAVTLPNTSAQTNKPIWYFLACWFILNAVQAATLEIHADEAYYWLYSRFLDWGYYDHPPMVAVFIRIGYGLFHNVFGLRLLTVITSTAAIYFLWLIVKAYEVQVKWFILLVSGTFIFHIYGFTTTPDAPLFLFSVLFYFVYKKYMETDELQPAILLALIIAGLLYSKYNGVLVVGFTLLSNLGLLKRKSFWLIVLLSVLFYTPHVVWQVTHNYPSITYHLFERSEEFYSLDQTLTYIPGQLLMAGPLIGWFEFYIIFKTRITDGFIRCLVVNAAGTFIFFFISSWKGEVQPHWTLIAFIPLIILTLIYLKRSGKDYRWLSRLAVINLILILVVRIALIVGAGFIRQIGQLKSSFGFEQWAHDIKQKAGNAYVVMNEGFQNPAKYDFYNNEVKAMSYDSRYYRRTQFEIWPLEDSMQHKRIYYLSRNIEPGTRIDDTIKTNVGIWYGTWINDMRSYNKVIVDADVDKLKMKAGETAVIGLTIHNPYPFDIDFGNEDVAHKLFFGACLFQKKVMVYGENAKPDFENIHIRPGQTAHYNYVFTAPLRKGKFDMLFSFRTTPFYGGKNSKFIDLTLE